jgi:hypothetical protein
MFKLLIGYYFTYKEVSKYLQHQFKLIRGFQWIESLEGTLAMLLAVHVQ